MRGRGWYYDPFPGGLPTRQQLDAVVPDRPAYLVAYDGHTGWANTKALAAARITRRTPNPPHGVIVKDPRTGEPTGVLKEAAHALMQRGAAAADDGRSAERAARPPFEKRSGLASPACRTPVDHRTTSRCSTSCAPRASCRLRVYAALSRQPRRTRRRDAGDRGGTPRSTRRSAAQGRRGEADGRRRHRVAHGGDARAVREQGRRPARRTSPPTSSNASSACSTRPAGRSMIHAIGDGAVQACRSTRSSGQRR